MNATKTISSFAIAAIALSTALFSAPMANAEDGASTPAATKTVSKKGTKCAKKAHVKAAKAAVKTEAAPTAPATPAK